MLPEDIAKQVIKNVFAVDFEQMKSKTRKREIVFPRQIFMTLLQINGVSSSKAGANFGKDHATALHAKRKVVINILETKYPKHAYYNIINSINEYKSYFPNIDLSEMPGPWHDIDFNELRS
jgi:chromosomal replication initiator protein